MPESADWGALTAWWLDQVEQDPAYRDSVIPMLLRALDPESEGRYLDLGCGEGQVLRAVQECGSKVIGCDTNLELLRHVSAPVVRCSLPRLDWVRPGVLDGVYACLVLEHVSDLPALFLNAARAVNERGVFALVINHPLFTAPDSGPIVDPTDGEVFWRWGTYLESGMTNEPAASTFVTFHHRPMSTLVNAAAGAGWHLEWMEEEGIHLEATEHSVHFSQAQIPRLMAIRWRLA